MADIASLILKVDAQQVDKGTQSLSDLQKQAQKTEQAAVKLGKEIGTTLAVGITTAGTATFMLVRNAINAADAMNDLNLKTGIAFKNLAAYDLLARQSGTSIEGVAQSFKFLGKYMVEHSDKLEYIGVTSKDSTAAMGQFADAIAGIKDPTLKTAVAMEVLGRSGAEMLPMLSGGSEAFKKAQEQTKAYGEALERVAPKADEFNDGISRMEIAGKVVGLTLAEKLLPTLLAVSDAMLESSVNSGLVEKWGTSLAWILKGVAVTAINVAYVLTQIGNEIGGIAAQAAAFLTGNFSEAKRIGEMMKADAAAARIEVDKMTDSILNAEDAKKKDTAAAGEQSKSMDEYARRLLQGNEAADKARKAEDSRQKSITDMIESLEKEAATFGKTTAQIKLYELALLKASPAQVKAAQAAIDRIDALQREKDAKEAIFNAEADYIKSINDDTESIIENNKKMAEHIGNIGKTKEEIALLASERENSAIKIAEETLATSDAIGIHNAETEALRENIKARKDRRDLFIQASSAHAALEQVKEIEKAEKDRWKMVDNIAHDTFMNIANKGKNAFKEIGASIKTYLLEMLYKMTVQKWLLNVGVSASGGGGAGGISVGGDMLGSAGSALSAVGNVTGMAGLSGFGAGMVSGASELALGSAFVGPSASLAAGSVGAGASLATAMGPLMTAAPYIAAAAVIANAIGLFGKKGGPQQGQYGDISASGKYNTEFTMSGGDALGNQKLTESALAQIKALASITGKNLDSLKVEQGYKLDPQGTAAGLAYRRIYLGDQKISGGNFNGNTGADFVTGNNDSAGIANFLGTLHTNELQALISQLADPKLSAASEALMNNFGELEKSLPAYLIAQETQKKIATVLMDDQEKLNSSTEDLKKQFSALGLVMPESTKEFAKMIAGIDVTTESGMKQVAALDALGSAFVQVQDATKATAEKAIQVAMDKASIELDIMTLTKDATGKVAAESAILAKQREIELNAMDESLRPLKSRLYALQDEAAAADKATAAIKAQEEAQNALMSAYNNLTTAQGRPDLARGNTVGIAASDLDKAIAEVAKQFGTTSKAVSDYMGGAEGDIVAAYKKIVSEMTLTPEQEKAIAGVGNAQAELLKSRTAIQDAADKEAKDAADKAAAYAKQKSGLEIALMEAQGDAAGALAIRRKDELAAMDESLRGIKSAIWAAQEAAATAATLLTWQNQLDVLQGKKTQKEIDRAELLSSVSDKTTLSVMRQVFALQDLADASDVSTANTDAAMAAEKQAIDAQKKIMQVTRDTASEQVKAIKSVMDTLRDGIRTLRGEVTGSVLQSGADGMDFIANALNNAKSSGYLPDQAQLQDAISSATAGLDAKLYTSKLDADRDRLRLANQLEAINAIGGDQLTTSEKALLIAENQLKDLDDQLVAAQAQIDLLRGINSGVTSVTAAIASLGAAISAEAAARTAAMVPVGNVAPAVVGAAASAIAAPSMDLTVGGTNFAAQNLLGIAGMSAAAAANQVSSIIATSDAATAAAISGYAHDAGIPGFASGTSYVPYDMTANIHEGEEITPRPYVDRQRASRDETNGLLARLVSSNDEMRAELKAVKLELAHIKNTNNRMMQTSEKWDTDGIPAQRV